MMGRIKKQPSVSEILVTCKPVPVIDPVDRMYMSMQQTVPVMEVTAECQRAKGWLTLGYRVFDASFGPSADPFGVTGVLFSVRTSAPAIVELETLRATPQRRGYGTKVVRALTTAADAHGVTLWLDLVPDKVHESEFLAGFYARFGFVDAQEGIPPEWRCERPDLEDLLYFGIPMVRRPSGWTPTGGPGHDDADDAGGTVEGINQ